jgi:hypothetical protein
MKTLLILLLISLFPYHLYGGNEKTVRILTVNIWSGVDYKGVWKFGEYEPEERRESRFLSLLHQIKQLEPDIIFIQEENFLNRYVRRLADSLSFDVIHQIVNAGIKFGNLGLPTNFKEGIAILADPSLHLQKVDAWKLSGSPGIHSTGVTIHFDEAVFALVGQITINNTPVYLVGVHLHAAPPDDPGIKENLDQFLRNGSITQKEFEAALKTWEKGRKRRDREVNRLLQNIKRLPHAPPVIAAGDFNADPVSPEMKHFMSDGSFIDTYEYGSKNRSYTWDPERNTNIDYSTELPDQSDSVNERLLLFSAGDEIARRIDYIFLNDRFLPEHVLHSAVVIDSMIHGVYASDHYGVIAEIDVSDIHVGQVDHTLLKNIPVRSRMEFLPILMYDTDIGFGYGGKAFLLNYLGGKESFDIIAFNSTKGERWYRMVFSIPDFEIRQGKKYPFALDLVVDYDKWIHNSFFGIGSTSRYEDREFYTQEPFEIKTTLSRGFSPHVIARTGLKYISIRNYNFEESSRLRQLPPSLNSGTVRYTAISAGMRYDTRDSYINPSRGHVVNAEVEFAPDISLNNVAFTFVNVSLQNYMVLFYPKTVLAMRLKMKSVSGDDLPVQVLIPAGGNNSIRGYSQNRFLERSSVTANIEMRFPIYWRFGGVIGYDAGTVARSVGDILDNTIFTSPVAGLRFYMDTFVVRVDAGFSRETMGFYFNFGQVF